MKMPWLSGRRTLGTASASLLATLLFTLSGNVSAGIADTRHNLGSAVGGTTIAGRNQVTDNAEICVFCHTPHGAATGAPAPLWNKRLGAPTGSTGVSATGVAYTTYASLNTPSLDGTIAPVGSISMACLSCHDGTQAMDNIINAPGSGGVTTDGGGPDGLAYNWNGSRVTTTGVMQNGGGFISNLGTDLSNDHPIGIQYCGGGLSAGGGSTIAGSCKDADFVAPSSSTINNNQVFWVNTTGGTADKQRTDLPLYTRAGEVALGPLVECATCHDPHVSDNQTNGTLPQSGLTFLRISNASSAVCTACHVK